MIITIKGSGYYKKEGEEERKVFHLVGSCPLSIGTLTYPRMGNQSKRED